MREGDRDALLAFLEGLSEGSRALRFFSAATDLAAAAERGADVDHVDRYGLVVTAGPDQAVVAHAMYERTEPRGAEIALAVADRFQGRGVGTILLGHLAEAAREVGIETFRAETLPRNHRMLEVFRESGFPYTVRAEPGVLVVEFSTSITPRVFARFEARERVAAASAMRAFLWPRSVAVIGASRDRAGIAGAVFHNLLISGFNGPVYPVNPNTEVVQSVAAVASVKDVPGPVDLAVLVVPAQAVVDVARECGQKGVRGLVVISAGFAETGEEGRARERELLRVCREAGMRLIGPNCFGLINTDPGVRLNATFSPVYPEHGQVGFMSQSGALGLAVIDHARALGLGLSSFVSVGNKADISGNDLLHHWEADPATDVILLYLESFGNPRKFARISRRVSRTKPIVVVKGGRSGAGARATTSHTGALIAASDITVDALFRQTGVIRTDTLAEMFDVASLLANQPLPRGPRVGIVTNAGGPGILCADACEAEGLEVPALDGTTQRKLGAFLPAEAGLGNPVDMVASASAEDYRRAIEVVAAEGGIDAVIAIFIPPLVTRPEDVAAAIREAAKGMPEHVPLLTVFMSSRGTPEELRGAGVRIPSYPFPEDAARALARAVRYGDWKQKPEGAVPSFEDIDRDRAASIIASALAKGPGWLGPAEVADLLSCYGMPLAEWRLAEGPQGAAEAAAELRDRVALKAVTPTLTHKTEAGGVRVGLAAEDVRRAAEEMTVRVRSAGHTVERFLVQRMVPPGVELLVGVVHDPLFGPVMACGAGGVTAELMQDVAVRITPLTEIDAGEMIRSLKTFPLLEGYRGAPKADVRAVEEILLRLSSLVEAHAEVAEMDLNPVVVLSEGASIVDARIRVEVPAPRPPLSARRTPASSPAAGRIRGS
ncbi:MAG TPA: GNAT family N-acetyltransferase [Actinomycetota bacterium]|nr:GNAT family N-acetyltransferase [Actinomycetota bacterium]